MLGDVKRCVNKCIIYSKGVVSLTEKCYNKGKEGMRSKVEEIRRSNNGEVSKSQSFPNVCVANIR